MSTPTARFLRAAALLALVPTFWVFAAGGAGAAGPAGVRRLNPEAGPIHDVAVSPDGRTLAAATSGSGIVIWRLSDAARVASLAAETFPTSVQYSADGSVLAAAYSDGTARLWNPHSGESINRLLIHARGVRAMALAPDGKLVAGGGDDGAIHLADAATGAVVRRFVPEPLKGVPVRGPATVRALAFSPDGAVLVSGHSHDTAAHVWDVQSGKELARLREEGSAVHALVFSPDGATLATAADRGWEIKLWETATWHVRRTLDCRGGPEYPHAFSPEGRSLWTVHAVNNDEVWRWDLATGRRLRQFGEGRGVATRAAAFPAGTRMVSAANGTLVLWEGGDPLEVQNRAPRPEGDVRLEGPWGALAGEDAVAAYDALWALVAVPNQSVPYLANRLPRQEPVDPATVRRLLAELDHEQFTVRERAMRDLARIGDAAEPLLREHLAATTSPEVGERLEVILDSVHPVVADADALRAVRAVEVLERIGTPAARAALNDAFRDAAGSKLKARAQAAIRRLDRLLAAEGPAGAVAPAR